MPAVRPSQALKGKTVTCFRFIGAVVIALLWAPWGGPGNLWSRARDAFWLAWDSRMAPKVDASELLARNKACSDCPIHYRPLMTCGSPMAGDTSLGCWCFMPFKSRMKHARCWLRIRGSTSQWGWKE